MPFFIIFIRTNSSNKPLFRVFKRFPALVLMFVFASDIFLVDFQSSLTERLPGAFAILRTLINVNALYSLKRANLFASVMETEDGS